MIYCKRCVMPDTRPHIRFDDDGVCIPCKNWEKRKNVDWDSRRKQLEQLADKYRGMLKFSDKLQELIMRQKELSPKPEQLQKYCYGFYPNPELFYDWETFQDMLFDGRLHGEEVEVVRGVRVEVDNEDFISPHQIGEDILAQAEA